MLIVKFSEFLCYNCEYMPMFLFPTRSFAVPFFLEEEFAVESLKKSFPMLGGVEGHTIVIDPAVMNSEEVPREPSLWPDRSRDLLPQNIKMLRRTKRQAPAGIHQVASG